MKLIVSVVFVLLGSALSTNEARSEAWNNMSTQAMEKVFARSEETHKAAMNTMTRTMTLAKAVELLEKSHLNRSLVAQVTSMVHKHRHNLRKQTQPKGYDALDGAKKMLNEMIYESMTKYDKEILMCMAGYAQKCDTMEVFRKTIQTANGFAANAHKVTLESQSIIDECDDIIPKTKEQLKKHNHGCALEKHRLNKRLFVVLADIEVMTLILGLTQCKGSSLSQFAMARCTDPCTKKSFVQFRNKGLQEKLNKLQSQLAQNLVSTTFADMFEGVKSLVGMDFLQTASENSAVNSTEFESHPPAPRTEVPGNPCLDEAKGAPSADTKRQAKCTLSASPQCPKLQERFMNIQAGIVDDRDRLQNALADLKEQCQKQRLLLEGKIVSYQQTKAEANTKLAAAETEMAAAVTVAEDTALQHKQLETSLQTQMKKCSTNYINYETEICALKKIRGELYKMKGDGSSAFFQDCEVSNWKPDSCSATCGKGGERLLTRDVLNPVKGGAKCLPRSVKQGCNNFPCPVDCKTEPWAGWSKCSAECGGGVEQRVRTVWQRPMHGGEPCGSTSDTRQCNGQSCTADCVLSKKWSKWERCSKDCDGGTKQRVKFVVIPARGNGECPGPWHPKRLEYQPCNDFPCTSQHCNKSLDVVLLLDGSGSMRPDGFLAEKKAALNILDSFDTSRSAQGESKAKVSIILYSGPSYWGGVRRCFVKNQGCRINFVSHFDQHMKELKGKVAKLIFPRGSTLTSKALLMANDELRSGRKDAKSVVVVITDGKPLSVLATAIASHKIRRKARLVWMPTTTYAPLGMIKQWASRRWQENVIQVDHREDLAKPEPVMALMADICPAETVETEVTETEMQ
jgi:hypothetical protein